MAKTVLFLLSIIEESSGDPVPLSIIMEATMTLKSAIDDTQWLKFKYPPSPLAEGEIAMRIVETKLGCDIPLDDETNPNGIVIVTCSYKIEDDTDPEGFKTIEKKARIRIQDTSHHEL